MSQKPIQAAMAVVAASALFAATTILAKTLGNTNLGEPLHPLQVSAGRYVIAFVAVFGFARSTGDRVQSTNLRLHAARTSCGWLGVSLMFAAVARMPLADATAISFLNPVFAMILAVPLLGERVGAYRWAGAGIAFVGVLILLRPGQQGIEPAALIALAAAMAIGLEVIFVKQLTGRESPVQILLVNNLMGAVVSLVAVSFVWRAPTISQWGALVAVGIVMVAGQALFLQAMRRADASFVMPLLYVVLVFATLYDFWIFGVLPDGVSLAGTAVILCGALVLVWRDQKRKPAKQV